MASTFPRKTDLPCSESKTISLRIHKDLYRYLKLIAASRCAKEMRHISIGDLIRDVLKEKVVIPEDLNDLFVECHTVMGVVRGKPQIRSSTLTSMKQYELFENTG